MGAKSKRKGKTGELEACRELKTLGLEARRGQQYNGADGSADIVTDLDGVHFEVKRTEALSLYKAMEQAEADAGGKVPVVLHRRNNKPWVAIVPLGCLMSLGVILGNHFENVLNACKEV